MRGCLIGSFAACSRCMIRFGLLFVLTCTSVESAEALRVDIGAFSRGRLDAEWQPKSFKKGTDYRLEQIDGRLALHASSRAAASPRSKTAGSCSTTSIIWSASRRTRNPCGAG